MATTLLSLAAVSAATAAPALPASTDIIPPHHPRRHRSLEYAYLDDLSGYALSYSSCLRVKIPQDNDDDAVEGNVNFYAGAYRAQYAVYATFHVCANDGDYSSNDQCGACDYDVEYATEAAAFLETTLGHWEGYCEGCWEACQQRRLEDGGGQMDCDACANSCGNYYQGGDDDRYLECAEAFQDNDGLQLYYGPQCGDDQRLAVGVFYDDECTIKASQYDPPDLSYAKFGTAQSGCVDCGGNDGGDGANTCADLYDDAKHCAGGKDQSGGDDEWGGCSAVKKALTVVDYAGVQKRHHGADVFVKAFLGVLAASVVGFALFLAYTYYVRHRGDKARPILSEEDVEGELPMSPASTTAPSPASAATNAAEVSAAAGTIV